MRIFYWLSIGVIFSNLFLTSVRAGCNLEKKYPHKDIVRLSNGMHVPTPTLSNEFSVISLLGTIDLEKTRDLLRKNDLYPIEFNGKAMGILSVFRYNHSDIGPFNELYFVVMATENPTQGLFDSFDKLMKSIRWSKSAPSKDISFFHLKVFSSTEAAHKMSEEIWHIKSKRAKIKLNSRGFSMNYQGQQQIAFKFKLKLGFLNPIGFNYHLYATGPKVDGKLYYSPVISCGLSHVASFNPLFHNLQINEGILKNSLESLSFSPFRVDWGENIEAAQFLPIEE